MAGLPPKPETTPVRDERRFPDDRDRRSAVPMAATSIRCIPIIPDRERDRERPYVPRPKLDSYIAPPFDSRREGDSRREYDDRERERYRVADDRRSWTRDRDYGSPLRRDIADRDRRPYDRDRDRGIPLHRRPPSPRRGYPRRDSRSPGWRRHRSRSRSRSRTPRYRNRSRSRSPRRPSPPLMRLGDHSILARSVSPAKIKQSRESSPKLPPKPVQIPALPVEDVKKDAQSIDTPGQTPSFDEQTTISTHLDPLTESPNPVSLATSSTNPPLVKQAPESILHQLNEACPIKMERQPTPNLETHIPKASPRVEPATNQPFEKESIEPRHPPQLEPKLEESLNSPSLATPVSTKRSLSPAAPPRHFAENIQSTAIHDSKTFSAPRGPRAYARLPLPPPPPLNAPRKRSRYDHISAALSNFPVPTNAIQKHQLKHADVLKIEQEVSDFDPLQAVYLNAFPDRENPPYCNNSGEGSSSSCEEFTTGSP
ncbi:hypothetical protein BJ165DRAFT_1442113 [Panaeolus papilionaceus]|nr:hypothetical protein BJ165DRAFT_1442113 [Panaeolus papilionaceus]